MNRPRRRRFGSAVAFVVLISPFVFVVGCVDQKKEVATYRKALDGKRPGQYEFHGGDPLTLEGAIFLANRNDETLASGGETYLQAVIDKERQFSTLFPTISLAPTYGWLSSRSGLGGSSN